MPSTTQLAELIEAYEAGAYRSGPLPEGDYPGRVTAVGAAEGDEDMENVLFVGVTVEGGYYDGTRVPTIGRYTISQDDERWDALTSGLLDVVDGVGPVDTVEELIEQLMGARLTITVGPRAREYADAISDGYVQLNPLRETC